MRLQVMQKDAECSRFAITVSALILLARSSRQEKTYFSQHLGKTTNSAVLLLPAICAARRRSRTDINSRYLNSTAQLEAKLKHQQCTAQ